jgi:predicted phosphodiesterase
MKLKIISDVHLEFHETPHGFVNDLDLSQCDVLVIAGDFLTKSCVDVLKIFNERCEEEDKHVIYVAGNHEYYRSSLAAMEARIRAVCRNLIRIHFLENDTITLEGKKFVGTTLWFPDSPSVPRYSYRLNDFNMIKDCEMLTRRANYAKRFLNAEVSEGCIVVTHHLPTEESVPLEFKNHALNIFYLHDCSELIKLKKPSLWIHGHTHDSCDYVFGDAPGTRIVCNPYGYDGHAVNPKFDSNFIVEV